MSSHDASSPPPFATGSVLQRIAKLPLSRMERDVLSAMVQLADWETGVIPADLDILADRAKWHRSNVSRARSAMARRGLLLEVWRSSRMVQYRLTDLLSPVLCSDDMLCSTERVNDPIGPVLCSTNKQITTEISEVRRRAGQASGARRRELGRLHAGLNKALAPLSLYLTAGQPPDRADNEVLCSTNKQITTRQEDGCFVRLTV